MKIFKKYKKLWIILAAVASLALILTSVIPVIWVLVQ